MAVIYQNRIAEALSGIDKASKAAMVKALYAARTQILKNLSGTRSGIQYRVPDTKTYYTASSPGEFPAVATGHLKQTITMALAQEGGALVGIIGSPLDYGLYLEKKGSWEGGREWLRPSLYQAQTAIHAALGEEWAIERMEAVEATPYGILSGVGFMGE
jgi:hypothetical protein